MRYSGGLKAYTMDVPVEKKRHDSMDRVGRDGYLYLDYCFREGRTLVKRARFQNPLQVMPPMELEGGRCAYTYILNPCGGLVGGDRLKIEIKLERGAHALCSSPSATRVYRSLGAPSLQEIKVDIGPQAILEWFPETVIPFAGSHFEQKLHFKLENEATLILWDAFSSGRVARGERWAFSSFSNEIKIWSKNGEHVRDRLNLNPNEMKPYSNFLMEDWDYFATMYILSQSLAPNNGDDLMGQTSDLLDSLSPNVFGGCSSLAGPGLAIRLVSKTGTDLSKALRGLWGLVRRSLLGLPLPNLRKY